MKVGGVPLIGRAVASALESLVFDRLVVSTDDDEIASVANSFGGETPFKRPSEFATDDASDLQVYEHAISWLETYESYRPDIVVWLRPTAPLRTAEDICAGVALLEEGGCDSVRSVCAVDHHPYWMKTIEGGILIPLIPGKDEVTYYRRQTLPEVFRLNGAVDVNKPDLVRQEHVMFPGRVKAYVMPAERSVDVDSAEDLERAERRLSKDEIG